MARLAQRAVSEEDDGMDDLERAEASIAENQKSKSKSKGKKDKGKGKEKSSRRESRNNASESEPEDESDAAAAGTGGGKGKAAHFSDGDIKERARDLVRLAICNEVSRRPLRRDEINKKVLGGVTRHFAKVFDEANEMLESVWGMELVPLFPNETEDVAGGDSNDKQKKKKKKSTQNGDAASGSGSGSEEDTQVKKTRKKGPARMFCIRTTIGREIIRKAVKSNAELDAPNQDRYDEDLRGHLGDAIATGAQADDGLKEWKRGEDHIMDWKTGPEQRTLLGILYVVLALIMVNERVLTDEQLQNHLKRLDLRFDTRLPLNPAAVRPEKQTLSTFLQALLRQQYLERTILSSGPPKPKSGASQAVGTQTQRVRSTQATQKQAAEEGLGGDPNSEWRWGSRALREFGEDGVASFIKDFYRSLNAGGRGTNANHKDGKTLLTEITKGATGNKPEDGLIPAREEE